MYNIKKLSKLLPINIEDKELNFLTLEDVNEYSKIVKTEYYNRYINLDYNGYTLSKIKKGFSILANNYSVLLEDNLEAKLLLKDKNNANKIIYGGATLYESLIQDASVIEIGYWINEKYTNIGLCTKMLTELINALKTSDINIHYLKCTVQACNDISMHIMDKLGFKKYRTISGMKEINFEYILYLYK